MNATLRLGDVVTLVRGTTYKSALLGQPGPALLGLGSIQRHGGFRGDALKTYGGDSPDRLLVQPGQVYASLKDVTQTADLLGAVARVPINGPIGRLTQDTVRLDLATSDVPVGYLYWMLRTPSYRAYCRAKATGTTTMGLPREDFFAFRFPAPNDWTTSLVRALDVLEDKIAANNRVLMLSDELIRAQFVLLGGEQRRLGDVADPVRAHVAPESVAGESLYLGLEHLPRRCLWVQDGGRASAVTSAKSHFRAGDVLFGKLRPYFHKVVRAPADGIASTDILVLRARDEGLAGYVLACAASDSAVAQATAFSGGTRMPRTDWSQLGTLPVPWPGERAAREFSRMVLVIADHAAGLAREIQLLVATRDELLPLLMSGKVQVRPVLDECRN